ncbi:hypothetical protein JAAARDRAFT_127984 [Jaapia argillacea MUCL 33604]|uniref:Uncharacterized protein n=1 Tax=Jaapia argillacea MUCL 33604 TaxID=933084 RepID=A0A067Q8S0_9AGAM|nr:hypothetical protein JAAARDRAFT_127984 [Jaapia argillacea MUCL 33604]
MIPTSHYHDRRLSAPFTAPSGHLSVEPSRGSPNRDRPYHRYSPYPVPESVGSSCDSSPVDPPYLSFGEPGPSSISPSQRSNMEGEFSERISLPPLHTPASRGIRYSSSVASFTLPPISSLESMSGKDAFDSAAVLRRLKLDDDDDPDDQLGFDDEDEHPIRPTDEQLWSRRRSLSAPPSNA